MLFVTTLDIIPGKVKEALRLMKGYEKGDVEVKSFLGMFGKPDAVIIFEAKDEIEATRFVVQFGDAFVMKTSLAFPVENI
ncbi:MAG: hypothetical protein QME40_03385 [bacterium]|nr:hypothetical protein [bacterium]